MRAQLHEEETYQELGLSLQQIVQLPNHKLVLAVLDNLWQARDDLTLHAHCVSAGGGGRGER